MSNNNFSVFEVQGISPYKVLGIRPSASLTEAKKAYRGKMKELHPDRGGKPEDMDLAKKAWDYLSSNADTMLGLTVGNTSSGTIGVTHKSLFEVVDV